MKLNWQVISLCAVTVFPGLALSQQGGGQRFEERLISDGFTYSFGIDTADLDGDGDLDIFVGTRLIPGQYPFPASSYLLLNTNGKYAKAKNTLALENIGMVTDAVFADIDNDSDEDLVVVGEWMDIKVLENSNGQFNDVSKDWGLDGTRGIWWSITASDIDKDGDMDFVVGNLGKNNKFKASKEHPFKVYANDFDNNGTNDVVLAKFYKDDYVPLRGRECTSQQMPYVSEKFKDYHSFASSTLVDILPEDEVEEAVIYEITSFKSVVLFNDKGTLKLQALPMMAQTSPLKSAIVTDVNNDGMNDIITVGNHYGAEVETTRYDSGIGTVLLGRPGNQFESLQPTESGFYIPEDTRHINQLASSTYKNLIVVTTNDGTPKFFKLN